MSRPKVSAYVSVTVLQCKPQGVDATMTRSVEVFQVDAFTTQRFSGNAAGVVLGAEALSDEEMQLIAREINSGDTAFVGAPQGDDHDLTIRFFTPHKEMPFVGHATLAAHAVLQARDPRPLRRQRGRNGIIEVRALDGGRLSIRAPAPPLGRHPDADECATVLQLLGLDTGALDPACPPQIIGSAGTRLVIGLAQASSLAQVTPRLPELARLSAQIGAQGYFLFAREGAPEGCLTESRMFCPALGIDEDPASGNAHGMLGCYFAALGLLPASNRFTGAQGRFMKRPSRIDVEVLRDAGGAAVATTIAGGAVIVLQGRIAL
ncbi:MAG: PhzF family phenazine biosynthesis isomerase [Steroidobacteraceae bacterium]